MNCKTCGGRGYTGDYPGAPPETATCQDCAGTGTAEKKKTKAK